MRFIHSCLRSSPYSTPPVPPTFALAPCPGPLTTLENSSRQLCESGGHKARMPVGGARHRPRLCNDPSGMRALWPPDSHNCRDEFSGVVRGPGQGANAKVGGTGGVE